MKTVRSFQCIPLFSLNYLSHSELLNFHGFKCICCSHCPRCLSKRSFEANLILATESR